MRHKFSGNEVFYYIEQILIYKVWVPFASKPNNDGHCVHTVYIHTSSRTPWLTPFLRNWSHYRGWGYKTVGGGGASFTSTNRGSRTSLSHTKVGAQKVLPCLKGGITNF